MPHPRFSVILPAFNRQTYLDQAVASVLEQSFTDFELFVMDDHSPTPLTVPSDHRITLIRSEENVGKSVQINLALERAQGEIIAFLDDDDTWCTHRLAHAHAAHQLGSIAVCRQVNMGSGTCSDSPHAPIRAQSRRSLGRQEMPGHMNTVSVAKVACPPFDPAFRASQDLEWGIKLQHCAHSIVLIESADSLFRQHDGPRNLNTRRARIGASKELLMRYANHYHAHPWQKAYRLFRIGYMCLEEQEYREAVRYAIASICLRPNRKALALLKDALMRSSASIFS